MSDFLINSLLIKTTSRVDQPQPPVEELTGLRYRES